MGSARPLDFGHWAAHKLEGLSEHDVRHGEAVAIGMALDSRYSKETGLLGATALERICTLLETLGFSLFHDTLGQLDANEKPVVLAGLRDFREHLGGELTVTLLSDIGSGVEVHEIDELVGMGQIDLGRRRILRDGVEFLCQTIGLNGSLPKIQRIGNRKSNRLRFLWILQKPIFLFWIPKLRS
jgi:3-dehydroquinate synthase